MERKKELGNKSEREWELKQTSEKRRGGGQSATVVMAVETTYRRYNFFFFISFETQSNVWNIFEKNRRKIRVIWASTRSAAASAATAPSARGRRFVSASNRDPSNLRHSSSVKRSRHNGTLDSESEAFHKPERPLTNRYSRCCLKRRGSYL